MKTKLLVLILAVLAPGLSWAQTFEVGLKAGFLNVTAKAEYQGISETKDESGFFAGLTSVVGISETFEIQPDILYGHVKDSDFIYFPIMAKYYIVPNFSVQAGPQINLVQDTSDGENTFGVDLAFGFGYNFTKNLFADARYGFELTDRFSSGSMSDIEGRYKSLMIGLGYKFSLN